MCKQMFWLDYASTNEYDITSFDWQVFSSIDDIIEFYKQSLNTLQDISFYNMYKVENLTEDEEEEIRKKIKECDEEHNKKKEEDERLKKIEDANKEERIKKERYNQYLKLKKEFES